MSIYEQYLVDAKTIIESSVESMTPEDAEMARLDALMAIDTLVNYLQAQKAQIEAGNALVANDIDSFSRLSKLTEDRYNTAAHHAADLADAMIGKFRSQYERAAEVYRQADARFAARVEDFRNKVDDLKATSVDAVSTQVAVFSAACKQEALNVKALHDSAVSAVKNKLVSSANAVSNWFSRMKASFVENKTALKDRYGELQSRALTTVNELADTATAVAMTASTLTVEPAKRAASNFFDRMGDKAAEINKSVTAEFQRNRASVATRRMVP